MTLELMTPGEPGPRHRAPVEELRRRYPALIPRIARVLLDLYKPFLESPVEGLPRPSTPEQLWALTQLDWIAVDDDGSLRLGYGFREGKGWDDAMFGVRLRDWTPVGEGLDD